MTGRRLSTRWYWVAAAVAITGVVTAGIWGVYGYGQVDDRVREFARTQIPGMLTIDVAEPGELTIFFEAPRVEGDEIVPALEVAVVDPVGNPVITRVLDGDFRFDTDGRVAIAVSEFEAAATGRYTVTVDGEAPATAALSVGRMSAMSIVANVIGALLLLLGSGAAALLMVVIVAVQRSRPRVQTQSEPRKPSGVR